MRLSVVLGVLLLALAGLFSIDVFREARPPMLWADVTRMLAKDFGAVVAFEAAVLLVLRTVGGKGWLLPAMVFHGAAVLLMTVNHQFFLHTGSNLDAGLIWYALSNAKMLAPVLFSGVDAYFAYRLAAAVLILVLAGLLLTQRKLTGGNTPAASGIAAVGLAGLFLAIGLPAKQPVFVSAAQAFLRPPPKTSYEFPPVEPDTAPFRISKGAVAGKPDNVVIVVLESFRHDTIRPEAPDGVTVAAPHLNRLAREGAWAESMYTTVSHTSKALVGILCGEFPLMRMAIREAEPGRLPYLCLPDILSSLGYRTAYFQTAPGTFEDRVQLTRSMGFETVLTGEDLEAGFEKVGYFGLDERAMLAPAAEWAGQDVPYLAVFLTSVAHHPYHVPGAPPPTVDSYANYLSAVAHVDQFVGALHRKLAGEGGDRNTIFLLIGDHGEAFGEHGVMQHDAVPYEEAIRIPAVFWGLRPGKIAGLRQHVDILPSLLKHLEIPWEGQLPGKDLWAGQGHSVVFTSCWYNNRCAAMLEGTTKYVFHFEQRPMEVFDLAADPMEQNDIANGIPPDHRRLAERAMVRFRLGVDAAYDSQLRRRSTQHDGQP